jgi:D-alanyl-D-alanine carboxypeptidase/D-alanyl-D-alanine-endopeptidase (penicillin-binding protein 4)
MSVRIERFPWLASILLLVILGVAAPLVPQARPLLPMPDAAAAASPDALAPERRSAVAGAVDREVRRALAVAPETGVAVRDLLTGEMVYDYQGSTQRIIASNTKLITTSAALDRLGPGFAFETPFLGRGEIQAGVLQGDLAVVGSGDPYIAERRDGDPYSVFRTWAAALQERGVRRVSGDLVLVHGYFERREVHPDWPRDQLSRWYEAPVSALSFNDNCVWVRVSPTDGAQARVDVMPRLGLYPVANRTRTSSSSRQHQVVIVREPDSRQIEVRGSVWSGAVPLDAWVSVPDPVTYFGTALRDALREEGITIDGSLRQVERLPPGAWERYAVTRTDLFSTLHVINKRSQNFYAESLLKALGAEVCGEGSWAAGTRVAEDFLVSTVGLDRSAFQIVDGSGMSRNNRFTPEGLVQLLRTMYFHPMGRELVRSLPYGGEEDLSWRRRLAEPPYRGNVFAKTGTLTGVSTLSGYAKGRSGRLYAFSILNNRTRGAGQARAAQDAIVRALIDNG